jgi:hypothetical protein
MFVELNFKFYTNKGDDGFEALPAVIVMRRVAV